MSPQPFLNDGEPLRCVRFVYLSGVAHECVLFDAHCTSTAIAYVDYFNCVIETVSCADLQLQFPCAHGTDRYVTVLEAEAGVPDSVGVAKSVRTGGIGRHMRFETIVHRFTGRPATLLVLLETMSVVDFEALVTLCAETSFRDDGEARYCLIPSKGCLLTHIVLARSELMRAVIARFAWAGLTVVCTNSEEFRIMQYTPDRLVRVAKTWKVDYVEDPVNLSPKAEDMWTWHGAAPSSWPKQFFTLDGLGMQIAKEFDPTRTTVVRVPYPLRCYIERELQLIADPGALRGSLAFHPATPRISDSQMMQMNHCAYVREFAPYDARRKERTAAISWVYLIHGHIVRIMGVYKLTGKFRGLGENLRVFADETAGARHIAPESMGRIVWNDGCMYGQKHASQIGPDRQRMTKLRLDGTPSTADLANSVA